MSDALAATRAALLSSFPRLEDLPAWTEAFLTERVIPRLRRPESRPGQVRMAVRVAEALVGRRTLLVEAGTGTGKSLAYLLPAVAYAKATGKPVIVATATITLQEQLAEKDVPVLLGALPGPVRVVVAKGRGQYVCLRRVRDELEQRTFNQDATAVDALFSWLREPDCDGDVRYAPEAARSELAAVTGDETCTGRRCPFYWDCYYFKARAAWQEADLILTNHALYLSDVSGRDEGRPVLPAASAVIFDEAHHLEVAARNALGLSFGEQDLIGLARTIRRSSLWRQAPAEWRQKGEGYLGAVLAAATVFSDALAAGREPGAYVYDPGSTAVRSASLALAEALTRLAQHFDTPPQLNEGPLAEAGVFARRLDDMLLCLRVAEEQGSDAEVAWVSVPLQGRASLQVTPIDVADELRETVFGSGLPAILTSATLTVAGRFDLLQARLGISGADTEMVPSPFNYRENCLLWVPKGLPDPNHPDFVLASHRIMWKVIRAFGGRTLVLFTSYSAMRAAYARLREHLPWPVYCQGEGDRTVLIQRFRENPRAVLMGTQSFWEGIDIAGPGLSCVIIDRLPFAVPDDPVHQARIARAERQGRSPFREITLPEAVLRFRQGAGRLIRTMEDRGLLVILDPRVQQRGYGRVFLSSLPGYRLIEDLSEAAELFTEGAVGRPA